MATLINQDIAELVESGGLISPFERACLQPASYDIRIGTKYSKHGKIYVLSEDSPSFVLQPGEFVLFQSYEMLKLPRDLCGTIGVVSRWTKRGLVSLIGPHVDPGFEGILIVPAFNAGDSPISLTLREEFLTIVFSKLTRGVSNSWLDTNKKQVDMNVPAGQATQMRANFSDLKKAEEDIRTLREKNAESALQIAGLEQKIRALEHVYGAKLSKRIFHAVSWIAIGGIFLGLLLGQKDLGWSVQMEQKLFPSTKSESN